MSIQLKQRATIMDLVKAIVDQLNVSEDQAKGGVGLILKLAKDKLDGSEFGQIENLIPDCDGLINSSPSEGGEDGGLMGAIGSIASAVGGKASSLGNIASLADGFSKLGLDSEAVAKFIFPFAKFKTFVF